MTNKTAEREGVARPAWVAPVLAAVVTLLVWRFGVETVVFAPGVATTLLGFSVAINIGFVTYLASSRR